MRKFFIILGLISLLMMLEVTAGHSEECRADIDGNGVVDGSDLTEMASDFGSADCPVKTIKYIICEGALSAGGRWCDNADGTVTDMTTGLVWLQDAGCIGHVDWWDAIRTPIENLRHDICGLSDGSEWGDWRLPTRDELYALANGSEAVRVGTPRAFERVLNYYWSSTTGTQYGTFQACLVNMDSGLVYFYDKYGNNPYVWPVRGGN